MRHLLCRYWIGYQILKPEKSRRGGTFSWNSFWIFSLQNITLFDVLTKYNSDFIIRQKTPRPPLGKSGRFNAIIDIVISNAKVVFLGRFLDKLKNDNNSVYCRFLVIWVMLYLFLLSGIFDSYVLDYQDT